MSWKVIKPIPFNPFKINGVEYKNSIELVLRIEELEMTIGTLRTFSNEQATCIEELENKIADIKANCDLAIEGRDVKIMELEQKLEQTEKDLADYQFNYPSIKELSKENAKLKQQIMKMRCCSNCRYKYKYCSWTSETIKDGKITSHYWNKEKQAYCDVGKGAESEYQLWEMKEND